MILFDTKHNLCFDGNESDIYNNDKYVYIDELIAPVIELLNKKGYKTKYCCSGHSFGSYEIAIESIDKEYDTISNLIYDYDGDKNHTIVTGDTMAFDDDKYVIYKYRNNIGGSVAYIYFEDFKVDSNIWRDFVNNIDINTRYWRWDNRPDSYDKDKPIIRANFNKIDKWKDLNPYERIRAIVKENELLYKAIEKYSSNI